MDMSSSPEYGEESGGECIESEGMMRGMVVVDVEEGVDSGWRGGGAVRGRGRNEKRGR